MKAIVSFAALAVLGAACGDDTNRVEGAPAGAERVHPPPARIPENVEPVQWAVRRPPVHEARSFLAELDASGCRYKAPVYGPELAYSSDRVVVTFFAPRPRPTRKGGLFVCHPVEASTVKRVSLEEPIAARDLFDGSSSPPTRVWTNPAGEG